MAPKLDNRVIARFLDGSLIRGTTFDFASTKTSFHVDDGTGTRVVDIADLKALFFVRDFGGNPNYQESKVFGSRGQGRRVEVTFSDGEAILGTTLNYRPDGQGFMVIPADPGANNTRIFVVTTALRRVRFL